MLYLRDASCELRPGRFRSVFSIAAIDTARRALCLSVCRAANAWKGDGDSERQAMQDPIRWLQQCLALCHEEASRMMSEKNGELAWRIQAEEQAQARLAALSLFVTQQASEIAEKERVLEVLLLLLLQ